MKRLLLLILLATGCKDAETIAHTPAPPPPPLGNAGRGRELIAQYGCNVCHLVPGVEGPRGRLGPSLQGVASRPSISEGTVPNTPENLVRFIQNPAALNPQSAMPPLSLPLADAQDIAAYLGTLR
jgi:cytochrome c2